MRRASGPLFSFRHVPAIGGLLAQRGHDVIALLDEAGVPFAAPHGEVTAPLSRIQAFIALCAARLEAPLFGIELAGALRGGVYGVAEFLVRSAPTLEAGMRVLEEFAVLINPSGRFRFVAAPGGDGRLHYSFGTERDTLGMHLNEYTLAYIVRQLGAVLGEELPLDSAWFSHARDRGAEEVAAHFRCPVRFQARDCGIALHRDVLRRAPRTADALLFQFLLDQARAQLSRLGTLDIVSQVVRALESRLHSGQVDAASTASALALSPRTLQRQLDAAGTTFRAVLAYVRNRRRAELAAGGVAEAEIARYLGFSDARAMRRSLDD